MNPRLITDADVLAGRASPPIVLGPGVLITPAARDRAVSKGWAIVEAGAATTPGGPHAAAETAALASDRAEGAPRGGCGCQPRSIGPTAPLATGAGSCGPTCGCRGGPAAGAPVAQAPSLPDGLHLVRVEEGRVVWSRAMAGEAPATPGSG